MEAQEQTGSTEDRTENQEQLPEDQSLGFPIRVIEDDEAADARERRERESEQREKDDLIAQQRMAVATEAMNEATQSMKRAAWWSFGAVAVGTGLLIATLLLTYQANRAAIAAVATNRAWMSFDRIEPGTYSNSTIDGVPYSDILRLGSVFINTGNSPALGVNFYVRYHILAPGDDLPNFERPSHLSDGGVAVPQGQSAVTEIFFGDGQFKQFLEGQMHIIFSVEVQYRDGISEQIRVTQVCNRVICRGVERDGAGLVLSVSPIGPQNTMS